MPGGIRQTAGPDEEAQVIEETVARWHEHLRAALPGDLDEFLADDVVVCSGPAS